MRHEKHLVQDIKAVVKRGRAEKYPADHHQPKCDHRLQRIEIGPTAFGGCVLAAEHSLEAQQRSMIAAPHHEIPTCSVPQTAQKHGEHEIAVGLKLSMAIAA